MSSRYVRNLADTWVKTVGVTYYPTINTEQNPHDDMWVTLEFDSLGNTKESYCDKFSEDGLIHLVFFGLPGIGYDQLLQQAEAAGQVFYSKTDPQGKLVLESYSPPSDFGYGTPDYGCTITFEYSYRS